MFIVHLGGKSERYIFSFDKISFRLGSTKKTHKATFNASHYQLSKCIKGNQARF